MPIAHRHKGPGLDAIAAQRLLQRVGLGAGLLENGRASAQMGIDLLRHGCAAPGNEAAQRQTQGRGQADDVGIAKKIAQEGFDRLRRVRAAQIEEDDGKLQPRILFSNCSTWAMGVSCRMPWPRLKMCGLPEVASSMSSTARSRLTPPATRAIGSRLP